jgi:hypothetical protein
MLTQQSNFGELTFGSFQNKGNSRTIGERPQGAPVWLDFGSNIAK